MYISHIPLLYSITGVYRGITIFLLFAPKHTLWVLVRTASTRRFQRVPTIYVLSKNKKNINVFLLKSFNIYNSGKNVYITWACFRNDIKARYGMEVRDDGEFW